MQPVKRRIGFDDVDEANEEIAALLAVLADLHTRLNAADVPSDGTLNERLQVALERLATAERQRGQWKAAAKRFRRRWRDACAESVYDPLSGKPMHKIVEWLRAVRLYPRDIFETSDPYTIYASFRQPINGATLRALSGLNLKVRETPVRNRYQFRFVPSPEDEV